MCFLSRSKQIIFLFYYTPLPPFCQHLTVELTIFFSYVIIIQTAREEISTFQYKNLYVIDFSNVHHFSEIHQILKEALDFPDYYGGNWSALWDCLTDLLGRPVNIEIRGLISLENKFPDSAKKLLEVLTDFKHYDDGRYEKEIRIVVVIDGKGHEIL